MQADRCLPLRPALVAGLVVLAGSVALSACDTVGADRPAFRAEITGAVDVTLAGRPSVGVGALGPGVDLYTFVLAEGFSSVTFGVEGRPVPRTYPAGGALVLVTGPDGPAFFTATEGSVTVESVDGAVVRLRFAFDAATDVEGGAGVQVEGTATVDLDEASRFPFGSPGRGGALVRND